VLTPRRSVGKTNLDGGYRLEQYRSSYRGAFHHLPPWMWPRAYLLRPAEQSFRILNMRSDSEDRTAAARIRDAAIAEFAANGVAGTSVRTIAATAGVSPGLVIHHFGSKDELRVACDEYVTGIIGEVKSSAMASGGALDVTAAFRTVGELPAAKYLARTLVDDSPHVAALVDEIVKDAMQYVAIGVESGMVKPSDYEFERAAILTIWSLGSLVLHEHLERLIGVDITADFSDDPQKVSAYMAPILEIYSQGVFTETTIEMMRATFVEAADSNEKEQA
jgi:AcrR family transcriptional regulator